MSHISTLSTLRAHLDQLESAIHSAKRKVVLRDLKLKRSQGRRKLNLILDPIARLPLELQSEIFALCMPSDSSPQRPNYRTVPMLFLGVSRLWRDIALATPKLWTRLRMESLPCEPGFVKFCRRWIERAKCMPLSLALQGDLVIEDNIRDFLDECGHQVHHLFLDVDNSVDAGASEDRLIKIEASFPSLKTLSITGMSGSYPDDSVGITNPTDFTHLLDAAPVLETFTLRHLHKHYSSREILSSSTYTSLERVHLGSTWNDQWASEDFLGYLTLPSLRDLCVGEFYDVEEFTAFLIRSSPPLDSLRMSPEKRSREHLAACFRLIPTLTTLTLDGVYNICVVQQLNGAAWDTILRTLKRRASRHSQLKTFQVACAAPVQACVARELRKLISDGLEIHVGELGNEPFREDLVQVGPPLTDLG
ncbi:hypothetical protein R3P38DRAFT_3339194 [Favolaschia claudopus]|uniref:F-box domain-containing protein n=1 Tax=Favolaschia claudopus TaxID=2862362 RepID=A0AAW0EDJ4_9AGAR